MARTGHLLWLLAMWAAPIAFAQAAVRFVRGSLDDILRVVPDDAFYYLQIARHLAHDGVSTADGIANTNGYHPLWMLLMTGLATLTSNADSFVRAAMSTSLAVHMLTSLCVGLGLSGIVQRKWAMTAAACWLVNPSAFVIAQQTVEATVYGAALITVFGIHMRIWRDDSHQLPARTAAVYGFALGMLCLARTEGIVVVALALCWLLVQSRARGHLRRSAASLSILVAVLVLVVAPWLWFSWHQVGTIVQDSGAMKALWAADVRGSIADRVRNLIYMGEFLLGRSARLMTGSAPASALLICALIAFTSMLVVVNVRDPRGALARASRAVAAPMIAIWLVYGLTLSEHQIWWLTLPSLAIVVLSFLALAGTISLLRLHDHSATWCRTLILTLSLASFLSQTSTPLDLYPWQPDVKASQQSIDAIVPRDARIGCFNAGIPMFFGARRVVALDGLVNHRARILWSEHRFEEFLRESDVAYIADERRALNRALRFARVPPTLEPVAAYPLTGWPTGQRLLWRVIWSDGRRDH